MIFVGSDHAGYELKEKVKKWLEEMGVGFVDLGPIKFDKDDDYPIYAKSVAGKVAAGDGEGILVCDTGEGMAIAANKISGVRATLVDNDLAAERSREHNDSNILVLGSELQSDEDAKRFLEIWLTNEFSGEKRHQRRLDEIEDLGQVSTE
jgi:ribose 5-phosphate isomerase B